MQKSVLTNSPVETLPKDEWDKLIHSIIKPYSGIYQDDPSDLEQEAWVGLLSAAQNFDPLKETKFTTYAYYFIKGRILRYILGSVKHNNKKNSLTEEIEPGKIEADLLESSDFINKVMEFIKDNPDKHLFVQHFFYDKSYRDLAAQTGLSHAGVGLKIKRILRMLSERLDETNEGS